MKKGIPVLDVIPCKTLPTRCPSCGVVGEVKTDGKWPAKTIATCPHNCGWSARYEKREETSA